MKHLTPVEKNAVELAARQELARRSPLELAKLLIPGFQDATHLRHIADMLEAVERGRVRRLCLTTHPGSGKSTLLQVFASWYLGRNPRGKIIGASAGAELAERNSRASRALFTDALWPFDVDLSLDTKAMNRWSTTEGGQYMAVGVDGLITGWRGNLIICDDLQNSAGSKAERDSTWDWFCERLMGRLEPNGAIVVIQQRWGEDDIPGRIMDSAEGSQWHLVRMPAISEDGKSLWPERWPIAELERKRRDMGTRAFETQFQGNPVPAEGNLIKADWLQRYDVAPTHFTKVVCALDAAAKTGVRNDYSAIVKIGVTKNAYFILDVWRGKVEFPALLRRVDALKDEDPAPSAIYVEDASNAVALIQALKAETRLPIVPVSAKGSKESRVEGVTGTLEAGKVFLPKEAPWLLDFERELLSFPLGKHDDQVDAFVLALSQVAAKQGVGFFVFTFGGDGPPDPTIWYDGDVRREEFAEGDRPDVYLAERDERI